MAKKTNNPQQDERTDYYKLHTEEVEKLVNASAETAPEVGQDQPDPYKSGFLSKIPNWIKALFIKFWFNGAACFFFLWGLGIYISDIWMQILVMGVALGIITDILVNNLFRFSQSDDKENDKWMMFPMKKYWTFFANIAYSIVVMLLVTYAYEGINLLLIKIKNLPEDSVALGVEPFLFGLMYLAFDLIFIGVKDAIVHAVKSSKKATVAQTEETTIAADVETEEQPSVTKKQVIVIQQTNSAKKKRKK